MLISIIGGKFRASFMNVSGSGSAEVHGDYTKRGMQGGYLYFNLIGEADNPLVSSIFVNDMVEPFKWYITNDTADVFYESNDEPIPNSPADVADWKTVMGSIPVPIVKEI